MKTYIAKSSESKQGIILAVVVGITLAFVLLRIMPLGEKNTLFLFALPVAAVFFLLVMANAKIALIALLFSRASLDYVLDLTRVNIFGQNIGAGGAVNLFVIILALVLVIRNPEASFENPLNRTWGLYLLICAIAVFYSPVPGRAIRLLLNLLTYYCMLTIPFALINSLDDKRFWLKVLLFSTILPVFFANIDLLRNAADFQNMEMRLHGTFPHPNILAFFIVFVIALTSYTLKCDLFGLTTTKRNILRIYLFNLFILLIATGTRNAWIACWGMFFLYGLIKERRYLLYTLIAPLPAFFFPFFRERIFDVFGSSNIEDVENLNSFTWRLRLWKACLSSLNETVLFGNGLAAFESMVERFSQWNKGAGAHNTYLEVLFETGLAGLVVYVGIYQKLLTAFYRKMKNAVKGISAEHLLVFCYAGSYAVICFADNMHYYLSFNWYFWFFMGIMMRSRRFQ